MTRDGVNASAQQLQRSMYAFIDEFSSTMAAIEDATLAKIYTDVAVNSLAAAVSAVLHGAARSHGATVGFTAAMRFLGRLRKLATNTDGVYNLANKLGHVRDAAVPASVKDVFEGLAGVLDTGLVATQAFLDEYEKSKAEGSN